MAKERPVSSAAIAGWRPDRATAASAKARSRKPRDRQDPLTTDREYSADELEFMQAVETYKQAYRIRFLADSDYLRVLLGLGYRKVPGVGRPLALLDVTA